MRDETPDLFASLAERETRSQKPLAERMRPRTLADFFGQEKAVGPGTLIRHAIASDRPFSLILWGPPGCGKTTLAGIIAAETKSHFAQLSAVLSGVKDIREVIEEARRKRNLEGRRTLLFVDEIHRFNKSQQDAFLPHVESGLVTLIGATTENPSFEVIAPLLSRCRVIPLEALAEGDLAAILRRALADRENGLGVWELAVSDEALAHLARMADGDARAALNHLEAVAELALAEHRREVDVDLAVRALRDRPLRHDKSGEEHYNLISALHKSLRGADPDGALYWLARMLMAGDDPLYIARRMVRFASEDIGNADPFALRIALDAVDAYRFLGSPEGELALAQAAVYLATAPRSNAVYTAWNAVREAVNRTGSLPVPHHIRNAPTKLMKDLGYGREYRYGHDYEGGYAPQEYLPPELAGTRWYFPTDRGYEAAVKERLEGWVARKARERGKS